MPWGPSSRVRVRMGVTAGSDSRVRMRVTEASGPQVRMGMKSNLGPRVRIGLISTSGPRLWFGVMMTLLGQAGLALADSKAGLAPMELVPSDMKVEASEVDSELLETSSSHSPYQYSGYPYLYSPHARAYPAQYQAYLAGQYGQWVYPEQGSPPYQRTTEESENLQSRQYYGPTAPSPYYPVGSAYPTYPVHGYQSPAYPGYPSYHPQVPYVPSPSPVSYQPSPAPYHPSPAPHPAPFPSIYQPTPAYQPTYQPHYNSHQPPNPVHYASPSGFHDRPHQTAFTAFHNTQRDLAPHQPAELPFTKQPFLLPEDPRSHQLHHQDAPAPTFPPGFQTVFPGSSTLAQPGPTSPDQTAFNPTPQQAFNPTPQPAFNPIPQQTFNPTPQPAFNPTPQPMFHPTSLQSLPTLRPFSQHTFSPTPPARLSVSPAPQHPLQPSPSPDVHSLDNPPFIAFTPHAHSPSPQPLPHQDFSPGPTIQPIFNPTPAALMHNGNSNHQHPIQPPRHAPVRFAPPNIPTLDARPPRPKEPRPPPIPRPPQDPHRPQGNPDSIPDRPARQQQSEGGGPVEGDALARLLQIAGSDWEDGKGGDLHSLNRAASRFSCPAKEGHFPDPDSCSVYYQCAHGAATKNTCQSGLNWNMVTNQCDWKSNVDCSINKQPGRLHPPEETGASPLAHPEYDYYLDGNDIDVQAGYYYKK